jgi:formate dehydrogenase beta subunit
MTDKPINMTRPLDLTHEKRNVGPQRIQRPIYVDLLPLATTPVRRARTSRLG